MEKKSKVELIEDKILNDEKLSSDDFRTIMSIMGWCSSHYMETFPQYIKDNGIPDDLLAHVHIWDALLNAYSKNFLKSKPKYKIQIDGQELDTCPVYDPDWYKKLLAGKKVN